MMAAKSFIFRFTDVEVREREFSLVKAGEVLAVEPKAFRVLLILLRNPQKLIPKDELVQAVWGDTAVTDNSLARSIALLRRALGDETRNPRYIETVPTVGYRFLCKVEVSEDALGTPGASAEPITETAAASRGNAQQPGQVLDAEVGSLLPTPVARPASLTGRINRKLIAAIPAILFLIAAYLAVRHFARPKLPTVSNIVRLTNDRRAKIPINGVTTDGLHLYFMEGMTWGSGSGIAQVAAMGGETTWIPTTMKEVQAVVDISPDKSNLLVAHVGSSDGDEFWVQPLPAGTPHRVGNLNPSTMSWTPDGEHIIYAQKHKVSIANEDGSDPHAIAEVSGTAKWFRFSPDGRVIRFSLLQAEGNASSIWEMNEDGTNLHPLLPNWKEALDQCCGRWSPDGDYYYFLSGAFHLGGGGKTQGIWVLPEHRSVFGPAPLPIRLTTGPLRFGVPTPSIDGKSIFAIGDESRVELFAFDPQAQRFDSYLGGPSAGPVAFSPDGKWIAYVSYPEMTLWKSRPDLSEKMELTFPPVRAYGPRWSPDGSTIAFVDSQFHHPWKASLLSASGGESPRPVERSNADAVDTDPMWTPDGKSIIFSRTAPGGEGKQAIYRVDLGSGNLTQIPGSEGLFSPRLSPDGRYIAALAGRDTPKRMMLLDQNTNTWSTLVEAEGFAFNEWSPDGKYVYVRENVGGFAKIVRVRIKDHVQEDVLSLKDFPSLVDPFAAWYGFTPDGKILLMRDRSVQEIYALTLEKK
jgi:Tol biopolymer transport system component/DNA-binding winged helix-turn-helix (wHTH) protein